MSDKSFYLILTIVGSFLSLGLGINAMFLKQLISGLAGVEKGLAVLVNDHQNSLKDVEDLENKIKDLDEGQSKIKESIAVTNEKINAISMRLTMSCEKLKDFHKSINEN